MPHVQLRPGTLRAVGIAAVVAAPGANAQAQVPDVTPLSLEAIGARSGQPLSRDDVARLVSGGKVDWPTCPAASAFGPTTPNGTVSANQIGTGAGFNPHWKTGRGQWVVRDDGTYCATLDYGHMMVFERCFQFFAADGQILMHVEPVTPGAKFSFQR